VMHRKLGYPQPAVRIDQEFHDRSLR
jgi:hypothetical protein